MATYIPCDALKPFVQSFAIHEQADEQVYRVIPGTGMVLGFQFKGRLSRIKNEVVSPLSTSGITGLQDSYSVFKTQPGTGTVLVYFKDGGAAAFFKQPLHELFRESISLDNFILRSELLLLEEQLCGAKTDGARITIVEKFLLSRINFLPPDPLVVGALSLIHKAKGTLRIEEIAGQLHTSQSPLEKKFRKAIGASPKKFSSIVRLKNAITNRGNETSLTALGYEAGFYDQAHFIKEFKIFTGQTPAEFFGKE
ncbi:MAG TPA: helix-turn-helix transcriptional regulator [Chitinophagaceae bacterium]|nr:helix-turn-helix transcriptional regulator [Chitinophagaceae bacterium]